MNNILKNDLEIVPFGNGWLYCPVIEGTPYVALLPIIEMLGLDAKTVHECTAKHNIFYKKFGAVQIRHTNNNMVKRITFQGYEKSFEFLVSNTAAKEEYTYKFGYHNFMVLPITSIVTWLNGICEPMIAKKHRKILNKLIKEAYSEMFKHFYNVKRVK